MKTLVLFITMALFATSVIAETYTWEDDQGTVNFTEDLGKVPMKYRKKVRIVGEEEPPPAEVEGGKDKPAVPQKAENGRGEAAPVDKGGAPPARQEKKAVYGGKEAEVWKAEIAAIRADVKAAEKQLVEQRERLKDISGMSRSEYLSIQNTVRSIEHTVLKRRKKLDELKKEAASAGVPAELME